MQMLFAEVKAVQNVPQLLAPGQRRPTFGSYGILIVHGGDPNQIHPPQQAALGCLSNGPRLLFSRHAEST